MGLRSVVVGILSVGVFAGALCAVMYDAPTPEPTRTVQIQPQSGASSVPTQIAINHEVADTPRAPIQAESASSNSVLSAEEQALLAADWNTLTKEQRVERAYALKKQKMADPEWKLGKAVQQLDDMVKTGEYAEEVKSRWADGTLPRPL